jgi:hypothetical protein
LGIVFVTIFAAAFQIACAKIFSLHQHFQNSNDGHGPVKSAELAQWWASGGPGCIANPKASFARFRKPT